MYSAARKISTVTRHHSDDEYLDAIRDGARTISEVADAVGVTHEGARQRLHELREQGELETEELGNILVWSLTDDE